MEFEREQAMAVMEAPVRRPDKDRTVEVFVFRHGSRQQIDGRGYTCWSPDSSITLKGEEQMKAVVARNPGLKECTVFAASPLPRAVQSLCVMMLELGHPPQRLDEIIYENGLKSLYPSAWYNEDPNVTVRQQWFKEPELVEQDGAAIFRAIQSIAMTVSCRDNTGALCISHGGPLDAAVAFARKSDLSLAVFDKGAFSKIRDFRTGEGVVFTFNRDNRLVGIEELRLPS